MTNANIRSYILLFPPPPPHLRKLCYSSFQKCVLCLCTGKKCLKVTENMEHSVDPFLLTCDVIVDKYDVLGNVKEVKYANQEACLSLTLTEHHNVNLQTF